MDKGKIKQDIDKAYRMIASIAVRGDAVKPMAMAMQHLENAFAELAKGEEGGEAE